MAFVRGAGHALRRDDAARVGAAVSVVISSRDGLSLLKRHGMGGTRCARGGFGVGTEAVWSDSARDLPE